jgi:uncharacterized protein
VGNPTRVLAIDGGGIRGIIPAKVLIEVERLCGAPTHELFDLIAGTSTGGIIALGLTKPDPSGRPTYSATDTLRLYVEHAREIFPGGGPPSLEQRIFGGRGIAGWSNPFRVMHDSAQRAGAPFGGNARFAGNARYDRSGLEVLLVEHFGDTKISEALTPLLITSYDMRRHEPVIFDSVEAAAGTGPNPTMAEAALATSAGPTYFPPLALSSGGTDRILVDGGVVANNPAMAGFAAARAKSNEDPLVISLGTGARAPDSPDAVTLESVRTRNWVEVAAGILKISFDGSSQLTDRVLTQLLPAIDGRPRYWRFQATLTRANPAMDDVSAENIAALVEEGDRLVSERSADLVRVAEQLSRSAES